MAQGNRRDEKMRSDRGEWDRKRTGFGNTDKRKKNRRSRPSGRERRAVKKYRLIRSGVLLLFLWFFCFVRVSEKSEEQTVCHSITERSTWMRQSR